MLLTACTVPVGQHDEYIITSNDESVESMGSNFACVLPNIDVFTCLSWPEGVIAALLAAWAILTWRIFDVGEPMGAQSRPEVQVEESARVQVVKTMFASS